MYFRSNSVRSNSVSVKWSFGQTVFGKMAIGQLTFRSNALGQKNSVKWFFGKMNQNHDKHEAFLVKREKITNFVNVSERKVPEYAAWKMKTEFTGGDSISSSRGSSTVWVSITSWKDCATLVTWSGDQERGGKEAYNQGGQMGWAVKARSSDWRYRDRDREVWKDLSYHDQKLVVAPCKKSK
jgi:hypothetical protein